MRCGRHTKRCGRHTTRCSRHTTRCSRHTTCCRSSGFSHNIKTFSSKITAFSSQGHKSGNTQTIDVAQLDSTLSLHGWWINVQLYSEAIVKLQLFSKRWGFRKYHILSIRPSDKQPITFSPLIYLESSMNQTSICMFGLGESWRTHRNPLGTFLLQCHPLLTWIRSKKCPRCNQV